MVGFWVVFSCPWIVPWARVLNVKRKKTIRRMSMLLLVPTYFASNTPD